jgi:hypothetical protein
MIICESYMFEFSISRDIKRVDIRKEVTVGKVTAHLCLTLIVKELKISVEHGRVVTTLNIIKQHIYIAQGFNNGINDYVPYGDVVKNQVCEPCDR